MKSAKFYHQGKKKTNKPSVLSGCLLLIGFGAIIFLFTLLEDFDDFKEYAFEVILALLIGIGLLVSMFSKKGKLFNHHITIKDNYFKMEKVSLPLENIKFDVYQKQESFVRYHLRDKEGKVSIYSVLKDDLASYFTKELPQLVNFIEEYYHKHEGPYISVSAKDRTLYYDLESGKYTLKISNKETQSFLPEIYAYDGKYKMGKPLLKKSKGTK